MNKLTFLLFLSLFIFSCGDDSDSDDDMMQTDNGSMTVIKDGTSFTIDQTNNTLVSETQAGQVGRRLDVRCNVDGGTLIISVSNWDFQNPPENGILTRTYYTNEDFDTLNSECMEIDGIDFCEGGLATYIVGTIDTYVSESLSTEDLGIITITENDPVNMTVSGTFEVLVGKFGTSTPEEINFSGTFTDVTYR